MERSEMDKIMTGAALGRNIKAAFPKYSRSGDDEEVVGVAIEKDYKKS